MRGYTTEPDTTTLCERQCEDESDESSVIERGSIDRESPPSCEISLDGDNEDEQETHYEGTTEARDDDGGATGAQEVPLERSDEYKKAYADGYKAGFRDGYDDGYEIGCEECMGFDAAFADDYDEGDECPTGGHWTSYPMPSLPSAAC